MRPRAFVSTLALISSASLAVAGPIECEKAADLYKSQRSSVSAALEKYTSCLSASSGRNDCSIEFNGLRAAQIGFELAVASLKRECKQ